MATLVYWDKRLGSQEAVRPGPSRVRWTSYFRIVQCHCSIPVPTVFLQADPVRRDPGVIARRDVSALSYSIQGATFDHIR